MFLVVGREREREVSDGGKKGKVVIVEGERGGKKERNRKKRVSKD